MKCDCARGPNDLSARIWAIRARLGPRPNSRRPGCQTGPAPRPSWAKTGPSPPRRPLAVGYESDGRPRASREQNRRRRRSPNPSVHSLPPRLLSPRNGGDGRWPWWPGGVGRAAPPRLARRRARSPEGERTAVEPAVDGAMLSSPTRATPASRSGEPAAPLYREVRRATTQARRAHRRRQWRTDQVGPAPFHL